MTYLHEDVDGIDPRHAEVHPDVGSPDGMPVQLPLGQLGIAGVEKLNQSPVLDHAAHRRNLKHRKVQALQ